jgi:hypothetical protein
MCACFSFRWISFSSTLYFNEIFMSKYLPQILQTETCFTSFEDDTEKSWQQTTLPPLLHYLLTNTICGFLRWRVTLKVKVEPCVSFAQLGEELRFLHIKKYAKSLIETTRYFVYTSNSLFILRSRSSLTCLGTGSQVATKHHYNLHVNESSTIL